MRFKVRDRKHADRGKKLAVEENYISGFNRKRILVEAIKEKEQEQEIRVYVLSGRREDNA